MCTFLRHLILILFAAGACGIRPAFAFVGGVVNPALSSRSVADAVAIPQTPQTREITNSNTPDSKELANLRSKPLHRFATSDAAHLPSNDNPGGSPRPPEVQAEAYTTQSIDISKGVLHTPTVKTGLTTPSTKTNVPHPFFFTENKGQWDSRVLYKCDARNGMTWFLERDGFTLLVTKTTGANGIRPEDGGRGGSPRPPVFETGGQGSKPAQFDPMDRDLPEMMRRHQARYPMMSHALKFRFVSSRSVADAVAIPQLPQTKGIATSDAAHLPRNDSYTTAQSIEPQGELSWCNNYFLGNDSTKWAPNCRNFTNVMMREVWEGIDIEWYENEGKVEFDFIVHPGFDASQIRIECDGLTNGNRGIGELGNQEMILPTSLGELRTALPSVYTISANGVRTDVDARFQILKQNGTRTTFGIILPNGRDTDKELRIDPLVYSTYIGGSSSEVISDCTSEANPVLTGDSFSTNFPTTPGAFDTTHQNDDITVFRLNSTCTALLFSTFIGGSNIEGGNDIIKYGDDAYLITGVTYSTDFPRSNASGYYGGSDAFVVRINGTGSRLIYSTYWGGSGDESGLSIECGSDGDPYIVGYTYSNNLPTSTGAFQRTLQGTCDGFATHFDSNFTHYLYSTFLGGVEGVTDADYAHLDSTGTLLITGTTSSAFFPTTAGAYDRTYNGGFSDVIVTKLNANGSGLIYSTFIGTAGSDVSYTDACVDRNGCPIIVGRTDSAGFPTTPGAYRTSITTPYTRFITKFNADASNLIFSTYFDSLGNGGLADIRFTNDSSLLITGVTDNTQLQTTPNALYRTYRGGTRDGFIAILDSAGTRLLYSTYLGGDSTDSFGGTRSDGQSGFYVFGRTTSINLPTSTNAFQRVSRGGYDGFVFHIYLDSTDAVVETPVSIPLTCSLSPNFPNPFNSSTTLSYAIPKSGQVELKLFDVMGREVKTLVSGKLSAGSYRYTLGGSQLASGTYFVRLESGNEVQTRKIVMLR